MKSVILGLSLLLSVSTYAGNALPECKNRNGEVVSSETNQLISIMYNRRANRAQVYVTGTITEIKKEDHSGLPHQKYAIAVNKDIKLQIVSNLDFGRVPVAIGKTVSVCGEFIRAANGMVHWTHFDPHGGHPDGFTIMDGKLYGDTEISSR